jgi:hypothetical protein
MKPIWLTAVVCVAVGCGNDISPGTPSAADRFPRLTHAQWEATVQHLFGLAEPPNLAAAFTPDPQLGRFDNNIARLGVTAGLWRDYQHAAELMAERAAGDPAILARIAPDRSDPRVFINAFGLRAFRRPLGADEVERYAQLFAAASPKFPGLDPFAAGVRLVVGGMLQSPFFLYRTELSDAVSEGAMPLGGYEVASRLSYLLWNTMPDDTLFEAARAGDLLDADGIRRSALRMLDDPRTAAQFRRFHFQAFSIADYGDVDKDPKAFPGWRREIAGMMQEEALRFVDGVIASDGGIAELLTSTKAYINADLAKIYGVTGSFGADYQPVELDPSTRAGLLTRAGFLARNATLVDPDPIHRGVFINLDIICRQISAPPAIPPVLERKGNTNRERVESITGVGTCGEACHAVIINPLGFAFEGYDAVGAYRTAEKGYPINSSDRYTPEVHTCYTQQLLEFILGRDLNLKDKLVVSDLAQASLAEHQSIRELVLSVVTSRAFRARTLAQRSQP